ncbi:hypothetical protein BDZ89DRAFT_1046609 [Hymenopellis radicata]|nr:hypothetical protein BDZ89DRAFT_1046609 [Hymenopellis radicata]
MASESVYTSGSLWGDVMNQQILPRLNLYEIQKFTLCSKMVEHVCNAYLERPYSNPFSTMLAPFMPQTAAPAFRQLMSETHAVISGASALAFFNLGSFVGADLDIYANFASVFHLGSFFIARGYHFIPHKRQHFQFVDLASYVSMDDYPGEDVLYLSPAIMDVFTLINSAGRRVHVIAIRLSIMHTILCFDSSE